MGTRYKGTKDEVMALNVYIKLVRAAESLLQRTSRAVTLRGLSLSQFGTLEALYHLGPMCQRELGEKQLRSSGNITMVVDNLEKRGLVKRKREGKDRRFITVHLTVKGRKLIGDMFPGHVESIVEGMKSLGEAEQKELDRLCKKLGLSLKS